MLGQTVSCRGLSGLFARTPFRAHSGCLPWPPSIGPCSWGKCGESTGASSRPPERAPPLGASADGRDPIRAGRRLSCGQVPLPSGGINHLAKMPGAHRLDMWRAPCGSIGPRRGLFQRVSQGQLPSAFNALIIRGG